MSAAGEAQAGDAVDTDEYGQPVSERYRRLGAGGDQEGMFVRFAPGFGLNVHIGYRKALYGAPTGYGPRKRIGFSEDHSIVVSGTGWERLCELVDEWRTRQSTIPPASSVPEETE